MEELEYLIKKKTLKEDYYIKFKQYFLETNNLKQTFKKPLKRAISSSIRANFYFEFLEYCIKKLQKEKDIYKNLSFQQKRELKCICDKLHEIHCNSTTNLEYISELIQKTIISQ